MQNNKNNKEKKRTTTTNGFIYFCPLHVKRLLIFKNFARVKENVITLQN
jgi:hypothetical protein